MLEQYRLSLVAAGRTTDTILQRVGDVERFAQTVDCLSHATADQVTDYFASHPHWKPEYRKKIGVSLRLFFRWAANHGHITEELVNGIPQVIVPRHARPPAPEALLETAMKSATEHERVVLQLGAVLGLRRSEIAKAHPRDREGRVLTVVGKGGRSRRIPLDDDSMRVLLNLERSQGRSSYYLPGRSGDGHVHPCTVYKWVVRLLGDGWTTHSLRRRAGREGFRRTRNIRAVQALLGQSSLDTTALYVHVEEEEIGEVTMANRLAMVAEPHNALTTDADNTDIEHVLQQITAVSARARALGLNVQLTVDRTRTLGQ